MEIRSGVEPGELIVTRGLQRMRDGVGIRYELPEADDEAPANGREQVASPVGELG